MSEPVATTSAPPASSSGDDATGRPVTEAASMDESSSATPTVETPIGSVDLSTTPLNEASSSLSLSVEEEVRSTTDSHKPSAHETEQVTEHAASDGQAVGVAAVVVSEPALEASGAGANVSDKSDDSDGDVMIAEAATPSSTSFELLDAPVAAPDTSSAAVVAATGETHTQATDAVEIVAATAKPSSSSEATSDDIIEHAASGDAAATTETAATDAAGGDTDPKPSDAKSEAKESTPAADGEKKPKHTNVDEATVKVIESLEYESALIRDNGEVVVLPKGWSTRESKTHGGKTYYVSPYGHTQWLRPPLRTGILYKWVHEIEVAFDYGRLGLDLKQIASDPGAEFSDLQVHIAGIYKMPSGEPSPAEIYNWGVKPEKRLVIGMRMTAINGESLAGFTYSEVLEKLSRVQRPVRIKFADITKGIVGRVEEEVPREETEEERETRVARTMQSSLRLEYFRMLVAYELHQQVWKISRERMEKKELELAKKCDVMAAQVESLTEYGALLEKERESLIQETSALEQTLELLAQQERGQIPSPEVVKTMELNLRNGELEQEIADLVVENEELRQARVVLEEELDSVQHDLDQFVEFDIDDGAYTIDVFSTAFLGSFVHRGSIDRTAENARELLLAKIRHKSAQLEDDLTQEQGRAQYVESEIAQFQRQMQSAAAASKREDAFLSGEKPPQYIFLENRIEYLRKTLRETVAAIAQASNDGDHAVADNLSIRRAALKDDLKNALDEMQRMEKELSEQAELVRQSSLVRPSITEPTEEDPSAGLDIDQIMEARAARTVRLQKKLTKLRSELQEVLAEVTLASNANDGPKLTELNARRRVLNSEMSAVQEQIQGKTSPPFSSERSSMAVRPTLLAERASMAARPSMSNGAPSPAAPSMAMRASMSAGPPTTRSSLTNGPVSRASVASAMTRASLSGPPPMASLPQERLSGTSRRLSMMPEIRTSRSSSDASMASLVQSVDSTANYVMGKDGAWPALSGKLKKHPSHSNERGVLGNMSLRGFQERWCVIDPEGFLRYYKRKGDKDPRGSIPLGITGLEIVQAKSDGKPNEFLVCSPTHQTRFLAKTRDEMLKWMQALELAHRIMVQANAAAAAANGGLQRQESAASSVNDSGAAAAPGPANEEAYRASRATLGF